MNIKKIVEGMTAVEVADVIDSNFKEVETGKADKVYVDNKFKKIDESKVYLTESQYNDLKNSGLIDPNVEYNVLEEQ